MNKQKILFVGYGNMALAIIQGFIHSNLHKQYDIEICGRNAKRALSFTSANSLSDFVSVYDQTNILDVEDKIVFLCIKPNGLSSFVFKGQAKGVVSVMAGVKISTLRENIKSCGYVRVMPNTAAKYQKSSSAVYIEDLDIELYRDMIESFGSVVLVDKEDLIDASIATSGSAPAFVAMMAQALIDSGVREGLSCMQSQELVRGMFEGFALLLREKKPQEIIDEIASPAGTTIEGISVLEANAFRGIVLEASHRAVIKAKGKI